MFSVKNIVYLQRVFPYMVTLLFWSLTVILNPRYRQRRGFFVFHVKFLHKNFVSREKVIIFAATSAKGQSKARNQ